MTATVVHRAAPSRAPSPSPVALAIAGSAAIATAFGMARYGYGLLLPDMQDDLVLGATALGAIGTLAYVSYVVATLFTGPAIRRLGERGTVVTGGAFAVAGTVLVAVAPGALVLGLGVAVAGASCGLVYPPFADAVARLPEAAQGRTLATINCGTGWGVAVAAPIAIAGGDAWRLAYLGFAACAVLSTLAAARVLPGPPPHASVTPPSPSRHGVIEETGVMRGKPRSRPSRERARGAGRLLGGAALVGLGSAAYWTFAVEHVQDAGVDPTAARAMLGAAGLASLLAMGAADLARKTGGRATFAGAALLEAGALTAVALAPASPLAIMGAAVAFGAAYNTAVAVTALGSRAVWPHDPAVGLSRAMGANAAGLLLGPLAGGVLADAIGLTATLLGGAAVLALAATLAPRA